LQIRIHHRYYREVVVEVAHDYGHCVNPGNFTGAFAAVAAEQFIAAVRACPRQSRFTDAVLPYTLRKEFHLSVVTYAERMAVRRVKFGQREHLDALAVLRRSYIKYIIKPGKGDVSNCRITHS
jgi:hypothetical protein